MKQNKQRKVGFKVSYYVIKPDRIYSITENR